MSETQSDRIDIINALLFILLPPSTAPRTVDFIGKGREAR